MTTDKFQVDVYCGAGQYYAISNDAVYEVLEPDNQYELSFMCILNHIPVSLEFGERDRLHCFGKTIRCNVVKTSINPNDVDALIPHFRVGLAKDFERYITDDMLIYQRRTLYGDMRVKVVKPCHIKYDLRKSDELTTVEHIMTTNMTGNGLHINPSETEGKDTNEILNAPDRVEGNAYDVRAFFEDSKIFSMQYGVKFSQYYANLSAWLIDCWECGYARS